ncbi:TPA: ABC transporter permease [Pseudomonas aeruginosa]|nr:ABC transporter permease [Pseudomonas aeruginosa]HBP2046266.1 ABC transporter permease [Pseudomonas aeruginosa]HBP2077751.1 ABC transporter permease [Pseudomonas aeruginosa]HBP2080328.1 ABC transporter permease [Pseudomonas aeruginosa]HBP2085704.1 ABC transporter permease [Pseudomonas aeruginosa]
MDDNYIIARSIKEANKFIRAWEEADIDNLTDDQASTAVVFASKINSELREWITMHLDGEGTAHEEGYLKEQQAPWKQASAGDPFEYFGWWHRIANLMLHTAYINHAMLGGDRHHNRLMEIFRDKFSYPEE